MTAPRALLPLVVLCGAILLAPSAAAHPVHTSHADADFNAATGRLEISLRVIASDLLAALQAEAGDGAPELSWEKTAAAELDRLLFAYLRPRFRFLDAAGRELPLQWVGRDADHDDDGQRAWFYIEVALPGGPEGARVEHRLLLDRVSGQRNTVRIRHGGRSVTLSFAPGQGPRPIAFPAPGAKK